MLVLKSACIRQKSPIIIGLARAAYVLSLVMHQPPLIQANQRLRVRCGALESAHLLFE